MTNGTVLPESKSALAEFHQALKDSTLEAFDGRHFVRVSKLKTWLKGSRENAKTTRIQELLREAYADRPGFLPVTADKLCRDGLLVFSILLEIKCGHLISDFLTRHFDDHKLPFKLADLRADFGIDKAPNSDVTFGVEPELFDNVQWKYCAPSFHYEDNHLLSQQYILPFCKRKTINLKGGTAHLWEVEVPAEFVGESLRSQVKDSSYESLGQYGRVR